MSRIEILGGVERHRRWSVEEKRRLVLAAFSPGAVVREVARRAGVHANQLYRWRQDFGVALPGFAEVVVSEDCPAPSLEPATSGAVAPMIEILLPARGQVRLPVSISPELAQAVISALVRR